MNAHDPTIKKVYLIIFLLVALSASLVLLLQLQENALMAVRSYVGAEGLWAKAQKDATRSLEHYAQSRDEADYNSYLNFIKVPRGDLQARLELQKQNPNLDEARRGFLVGGNNPEDIEYMINLFLRFQKFDFMAEAIRHWTLADMFIDELNVEAVKLHSEITSGVSNGQKLNAYLSKIDSINALVTEQENLFSFTLSAASRWANKFARNATYALSSIFVLIGFSVSWPIIISIRRSKEAERLSAFHRDQALYELETINNNASIGIVVIDMNRIILRINHYIEVVMLGYKSGELVGSGTRVLYPTQEIYDQVGDEVYTKLVPQINYYRFETMLVRKDGRTFLSRWVGSFVDPEVPSKGRIWLVSDITEEKSAENLIKELAFYDPLTHLANRRLLIDRLKQALAASARSGRDGALLFIDLDNFKAVNDTQGHVMGDVLLQEVGNRLSNSFREADTIARIGGDEFVIVLSDFSEKTEEAALQAEAMGQKVLDTLSKPYVISGREYRSTPSIGIALFGEQHGGIDELMKQADIAMYQAKSAGRNTWRFFYSL